jgi:hypothetical protein
MNGVLLREAGGCALALCDCVTLQLQRGRTYEVRSALRTPMSMMHTFANTSWMPTMYVLYVVQAEPKRSVLRRRTNHTLYGICAQQLEFLLHSTTGSSGSTCALARPMYVCVCGVKCKWLLDPLVQG